MNDFILAGLVFIIAFPFGFWRARSKFRSRDWMVAIHIPVLFIIGLRLLNKFYFNIGFSWRSLLLNFLAFFLAQWIAGLIDKRFLHNDNLEL